MQNEFLSLLLTSVAVSDFVGDRVEWVSLEPGTDFPAIVLHLIDDVEGVTQQGPDGLSRGRVQVDCFGLDYDDLAALAKAVRALLHGHQGGGFQVIILAGRRDDHETGAVDVPFRISLDFLTNWSEANA